MPNVRKPTNPFTKVICVSTMATPLGHCVRTSMGVAGTNPKIQVAVHGLSILVLPAGRPVSTTWW